MSVVGRPDTVGVLGGMGPAATVDFFGKLVAATPAASDADHLPVVIANLPQVPSRQLASRGLGPSPLPALIAGRDLLVNAGAQLIAMPCNSAHVWFDALVADCPVPFLHIVDTAAATLAPSSVVGVAGAPATLSSGLYDRRLEAMGFTVVRPTEAEADALERAIDAVKGGELTPAIPLLTDAARAQLDRGAAKVILACTELPLLLPHLEPTLAAQCVDATDALARAAVEQALALRRRDG